MAKLPITRFPGESHEDWTRRHCREKHRIYADRRRVTLYVPHDLWAELPQDAHKNTADWDRLRSGEETPAYRAAKPKGPRRFRGPNKIPSPLRAEFPQEPNETPEDWERRICRIKVARRRAANPEKEAVRRRELYALNGKPHAAIEWGKANPEKVAGYAKDYFLKNKESRLAALKEWNAANPDRMREVKRQWMSENRAVMNAANGRYRARAELATPVWADWDEIQKVYNLARKLTRQTGIPHQVDHVIPLRGKTVSGLHVHHNLQVITKAANIAKRNYLTEV